MASGKQAVAVPGEVADEAKVASQAPETISEGMPTDKVSMLESLIAEVMDRQEEQQQRIDRLEAMGRIPQANVKVPEVELPSQAEAIQLSKKSGKAVLSRDGYVTA